MDETADRLVQLEQKYEEQIAEAIRQRAEAERDLAAVRRVRALLGKGDPTLPFSTNSNGSTLNITQAVKDAVEEADGRFEQPQITQMILDKYPDAQVNPAVVVNALTRMVKRKQGVRLVKRGKGSGRNVYEKITDESTLQENHMSG
jgi:hypothetical protein